VSSPEPVPVVPGEYMSDLGMSYLNQSLRQKGITMIGVQHIRLASIVGAVSFPRRTLAVREKKSGQLLGRKK
jgi:hypothetical protein